MPKGTIIGFEAGQARAPSGRRLAAADNAALFAALAVERAPARDLAEAIAGRHQVIPAPADAPTDGAARRPALVARSAA